VQAKERGYQIVRTADELGAVTKADQDAPLLGLFADGNMPVRWAGPPATRQGFLKPAAKCTDNPEHGSAIPKLADMTQKAIDLLTGSQKRKEK
jgi:alkaline phosphatase